MDKSCYCDNIESVENYEAVKKDNFKGWQCHHRLETHNSDGERRPVDISLKELIVLDMYYHRPAEELIFMTTLEHKRLHTKGKKMPAISAAKKGHRCSEETKRKLSTAHKGRVSPNKGKHFSEEHKRKLSAAMRGKHWKLVDGK